MSPLDDIAERVQAVADCGVDYVKVGIERDAAAHDVLTMLAACGRPVVPVLLADRGLDAALITHAAGLRFAGLMVDTADKQAGSLFDCVPTLDAAAFIATARAASMMCGLAGALRIEHLPQLLALGADFAGFRTAVCNGDRRGALDPQRLRALRQAVSPISSERTESSALL